MEYENEYELYDGTKLTLTETSVKNLIHIEWIDSEGELIDDGNFTIDLIDEYKENWEAFIEDNLYTI